MGGRAHSNCLSGGAKCHLEMSLRNLKNPRLFENNARRINLKEVPCSLFQAFQVMQADAQFSGVS